MDFNKEAKKVEERLRAVIIKRGQYPKGSREYENFNSLVFINRAMLKHLDPKSDVLDFRVI